MKKIKLLIGALLAISLSGCGASYYTQVVPQRDMPNQVYFNVNQASTIGNFSDKQVKEENLKYAFASAAKYVKEKGYTHFTIMQPHLAVEAFKESNAKTVEDVVQICHSGKAAFKEEWFSKNNNEGCDQFITTHISGAVINTYFPVTMRIRYQNTNAAEDTATFNAEDVLNSSVIKALDTSKY